MSRTSDQTAVAGNQRIQYLDGFRGIAILWVTVFHLLYRWKEIIPYGEKYSLFLFAKVGWMGVPLFFMVSGYVIFLTLEGCSSFKEFVARRWIRLFPAMLIVSLLVWATSPLLSERPLGIPPATDLLPGLLFLEPAWINVATGLHTQMLEGTFWTLFVEVKFYFIFGGLWFAFGRRTAMVSLGVAFVVSLVSKLGAIHHPGPVFGWMKFIFMDMLTFQYFGWFLHGALVYQLGKRFSWSKVAILLALTTTHTIYAHKMRDPGSDLATLWCAFMFTFAIWSPRLRGIVSWRPLLLLGFLSYPYYLVHEGMSVALVLKLHRLHPGLPDFILPMVAFLSAAVLSWLIARYPEKQLRSILARTILPRIRSAKRS